MKIVICDDSKKDIDYLYPIIHEFFTFNKIPIKIDTCMNGKDLLNMKDEYFLLIMDICLVNQNGMDIVREFHLKHPNTRVLYYSSNIDYAYLTYDAYGDGFIRKPIDVDNLYRELIRMTNLYKLNQLEIPEIQGVNITIDINKIMYVKANKRYSTVVMINQIIESKKSISEWKNILSSYKSFEVCRRGYIVNFFAIKSIDKFDKIHLKNNETIQISSRIKNNFNKRYIEFWGDII